jgi:hypothetical protein
MSKKANGRFNLVSRIPRDPLFDPFVFWMKERKTKYRIEASATHTKINKISIYNTILL